MVVQTLTGSGTFTIPAGVTTLVAECIGGGGGGPGLSQGLFSGAALSGGAGGGAYARKTYTVVPGQTYAYSVGAAGTGGAASNVDGVNGGTSWFQVNGAAGCVAAGGGKATVSGNAGAGGSIAASYGDTVFQGGTGGNDNGSTNSGPGGGAAGPGGNGGNATATNPGVGQSPGGDGGAGWAGGSNGANAGNSYGGGAGGTTCGFAASVAGAAGGIGTITLTYTPRFNITGSETLALADAITVGQKATADNAGTFTELLASMGIRVSETQTAIDGQDHQHVALDSFTATESSQLTLWPASPDSISFADSAVNLGGANPKFANDTIIAVDFATTSVIVAGTDKLSALDTPTVRGPIKVVGERVYFVQHESFRFYIPAKLRKYLVQKEGRTYEVGWG